MRSDVRLIVSVIAISVVACVGGDAHVKLEDGIGPDPILPLPERSLVPVVNIAPAKGWSAGDRPVAADGLAVSLFAEGLDHPRWLYVLPNGDVLVAETAAPAQPEDGKGIKGFFMRRVPKRAGAAVPSAKWKLLRCQYRCAHALSPHAW